MPVVLQACSDPLDRVIREGYMQEHRVPQVPQREAAFERWLLKQSIEGERSKRLYSRCAALEHQPLGDFTLYLTLVADSSSFSVYSIMA